MKKTNLIAILLFTAMANLLSGFSCGKNKKDCHVFYELKNNTPNAIYTSYLEDSNITKLNYPPGASPSEFKCNGNSSIKMYNTGNCYENFINASPTGKFYIYIFDANTIETTPWETVKQNRLFLKRYDFTKNQLDSCNWHINYP